MCTIFTVVKNSNVFYCNNEDNERETDETFIVFIPSQTIPSEWLFPDTNELLRSYGFVLVGVREEKTLYPQGGMNEHGLAFDINFLPQMQFKGIEGKPWRRGFNFFDLMMVNKNITEIQEFYETHHQSSGMWGAGQIHFADASGKAMIAGMTKDGELGFKFREEEEFLISTNFSLLNPESKIGFPCERYDTAEKMLKELIGKDQITVEELANILDVVKLEFGKLGPKAGTFYSNIFDLRRKKIYLYHLQDFSKVKKFELKQELKKELVNDKIYNFADNAEEERFMFERMQVHIIEDLFK
jgi:penicillin V acylase-like amidase (Ntn superfamily)